MEEIKFIKSMQTLELRENDLLVVMKGKVKIFVLDEDIDIAILRDKGDPDHD